MKAPPHTHLPHNAERYIAPLVRRPPAMRPIMDAKNPWYEKAFYAHEARSRTPYAENTTTWD